MVQRGIPLPAQMQAHVRCGHDLPMVLKQVKDPEKESVGEWFLTCSQWTPAAPEQDCDSFMWLRECLEGFGVDEEEFWFELEVFLRQAEPTREVEPGHVVSVHIVLLPAADGGCTAAVQINPLHPSTLAAAVAAVPVEALDPQHVEAGFPGQLFLAPENEKHVKNFCMEGSGRPIVCRDPATGNLVHHVPFFLDTETTGLDLGRDRILQLALGCSTTGQGWDFNLNCSPADVHIAALHCHGISTMQAHHNSRPYLRQVAPWLIGVVQSITHAVEAQHPDVPAVPLLIGHNIIRFDLPLLLLTLMREGVPIGDVLEWRVLDTLPMAEYCVEPRGQSPGAHTLATLCELAGLGPQPSPHNAQADVCCVRRLLPRLWAHLLHEENVGDRTEEHLQGMWHVAGLVFGRSLEEVVDYMRDMGEFDMWAHVEAAAGRRAQLSVLADDGCEPLFLAAVAGVAEAELARLCRQLRRAVQLTLDAFDTAQAADTAVTDAAAARSHEGRAAALRRACLALSQAEQLCDWALDTWDGEVDERWDMDLAVQNNVNCVYTVASRVTQMMAAV